MRTEKPIETVKYSKDKKAVEYDRINIVVIKYASATAHHRFLDLINICWRTGYISENWVGFWICNNK
jgi:hypothetical protein